MSAVQLCIFTLFHYRFDGISSTKVATVQSTYNFTHAWVFSCGPRAVTRGDHFFPCEGITVWGMLCSTATRVKLRERKQQPDIEFSVNL